MTLRSPFFKLKIMLVGTKDSLTDGSGFVVFQKRKITKKLD